MSSSNNDNIKVALLLSGCGVYDGSEITESVSTLIHLSRAGATVKMFAPDKEAMHVINHTNGKESENDRRNVLEESARIARGSIQSLDECKAADFDALISPGGFGVAKNLCDYATKGGNEMTVDPSVQRVLGEFHKENKVLGFCCIAPVLAAKCIPGVALTVGSDDETNSQEYPYAGTAKDIETMGGKHIVCPFDQAHVDQANRVVSAPAYMYNGQPHEIDDSVKAMVDQVLKLVSANKKA